jgi:hypothetical protein
MVQKKKKLVARKQSEIHVTLQRLHHYVKCLSTLSPGARQKLLEQVEAASEELDPSLMGEIPPAGQLRRFSDFVDSPDRRRRFRRFLDRLDRIDRRRKGVN